MAPEFASNVAHCDQILVSLIRLRPRVKLSTRSRLHLLVGKIEYLRRRTARTRPGPSLPALFLGHLKHTTAAEVLTWVERKPHHRDKHRKLSSR